MDVYFSTITRGAPIRQAGELIRLDWKTKVIGACMPIYPDQPEVDDQNPRGNTRGGRGITLVGDKVMCCSWHSLMFFEREYLNETHRITHPMMVDLHEVSLEDDGTMFISSTALDAVFQVDLMTGEILNDYWPRSDERIQGLLGVGPLEFDPKADNRIVFAGRNYKKEPGHLHINTVARHGGETYILSHSFGAIINLDRREIVAQHRALKGAHNLVFHGDYIYNSDSLGKKVSVFDRKTGKMVRVYDLLSYPEIAAIDEAAQPSEWQETFGKLKQTPLRLLKHTPIRKLYYSSGMQRKVPANPLFVRGLDISNGSIFVGFSPASVAEIDIESGELVSMFQYSRDVHDCVHGLKVVA